MSGWMTKALSLPRRALKVLLRPVVLDILNNEIRVWGDPSRVRIARTARMVNTLFNVMSGTITIGDYTFTGHNVSIVTGTHDYNRLMEPRMLEITRQGRDIRIGKGVWIGSNAVILGPCEVGDHAVIAAGAVVTTDVPAHAVVGGVPAKLIRLLSTSGQ
jgi:acetyltransferase-like isoleucine patch superfamily enzyme